MISKSQFASSTWPYFSLGRTRARSHTQWSDFNISEEKWKPKANAHDAWIMNKINSNRLDAWILATYDRAFDTPCGNGFVCISHNFRASSVEPKFITVSSANGSLWMTTAHERPDSSAASSNRFSFVPLFLSIPFVNSAFHWHGLRRLKLGSSTTRARTLSHSHTRSFLQSIDLYRRVHAFPFSVDVRSQLNWDLWTGVERIKRYKSNSKLCAFNLNKKCISLIVFGLEVGPKTEWWIECIQRKTNITCKSS